MNPFIGEKKTLSKNVRRLSISGCVLHYDVSPFVAFVQKRDSNLMHPTQMPDGRVTAGLENPNPCFVVLTENAQYSSVKQDFPEAEGRQTLGTNTKVSGHKLRFRCAVRCSGLAFGDSRERDESTGADQGQEDPRSAPSSFLTSSKI